MMLAMPTPSARDYGNVCTCVEAADLFISSRQAGAPRRGRSPGHERSQSGPALVARSAGGPPQHRCSASCSSRPRGPSPRRSPRAAARAADWSRTRRSPSMSRAGLPAAAPAPSGCSLTRIRGGASIVGQRAWNVLRVVQADRRRLMVEAAPARIGMDRLDESARPEPGQSVVPVPSWIGLGHRVMPRSLRRPAPTTAQKIPTGANYRRPCGADRGRSGHCDAGRSGRNRRW